MNLPPSLPRHRGGSLSLTALLAALLACGGENGVQPPGPPSQLVIVAGNNQEGTVGAPVAIDPSVKVTDANGRPIAGISVRFDVMAGGGSVTGDSVVTDLQGVATVTEWRLGSTPGNNQLRAQALGHPLMTTLTATAKAGAPSSIQIVSGGALLNAIVGQEVIPVPAVRVRDAFGNPISGGLVTWTVTQGGGQVIGPTQTQTDAEGKATVGGWRLGTTQGANQLQARTANGIVVTFTALGIGIPTSMTATSPTNQTGFASFAVPKTARVQVLGDGGTPVIGIPVLFTQIAGSGTLSGTTVITDNNGIAALGDWRLGPGGQSTVEATVPGFPGNSVTFNATGAPTSFTIDLRFVGETPPNLRHDFVAAAMRWMEVIIGDLPNGQVNIPAGFCAASSPALNEIVDDMVIFAQILTIDGPGNILGQAGACLERSGSLLTSVGWMEFDVADAVNLNNQGRFFGTALHEMGHVLGMTKFRWTDKNVMQGRDGPDPIFTGNAALAAWPSLGITYSGQLIPLENTGGGGTRDSHWRESVLDAELMTGFIEAAGIPMPLSRITVQSLADIGYLVDPNKADPFTSALREGVAPAAVEEIREVILPPVARVRPDGTLVPIN